MQNIKELAKNFKGNVLCIGVSDLSFLNQLSHMKSISVFTIQRNPSRSIFSRKRKKGLREDGRKVNMKKLRKAFKKKSIDYLVCDISEIYDYFKYFLYDSVVINRGKTYLYGESKYIDPNVLARRFHRYHAKTKVETEGDSFLIIVDNKDSRGSWLLSRWYVIVDSFHNLGDMISAALIS